MQTAQTEKMLLSSALLQNVSSLKFLAEAHLESYRLASVTRVDKTCLTSFISHCFSDMGFILLWATKSDFNTEAPCCLLEHGAHKKQ